jgi:putative endonuclease
MRAKDILGRRGEELATEYLRQRGFEVIQRNWRCPIGEIDIVARTGPTLVVVEVKTRASTAYGHPFEAITPEKLRRLYLLASAWRAAHDLGRGPVRVDVVGILCPATGEPTIEHLQGVA